MLKEISTAERPPVATLIQATIDRLHARAAKLTQEKREAEARGDRVKVTQLACALRMLAIRGQQAKETIEHRGVR